MEKAKTRKIKKWDEVHGEHEVEVSDNAGGCEPEEVAGASPSISRNPMRSIEDIRGFNIPYFLMLSCNSII